MLLLILKLLKRHQYQSVPFVINVEIDKWKQANNSTNLVFPATLLFMKSEKLLAQHIFRTQRFGSNEYSLKHTIGCQEGRRSFPTKKK